MMRLNNEDDCLSLCFLIRGHSPLLMVCSTRRRTGTTVTVMTGASTAKGATGSDLQVGIYLFACIFAGLMHASFFSMPLQDKCMSQ